MKAMILAAGKGTRVRPITYTIPKPMIPIMQKPVMEFLLELLRQHGFNQVMVNVSHLANEIEGYFRDGQRFGVEIAYSFEGRIVDGQLVGDARGSAGGMKKIQDFSPFFDDTFVVLCGDALINLDLTEAVRRHKEKGSIATIVTKSVPLKQVPSYGVVVMEETGRVKSFQEKPAVEEALSTDINTGIYIFEPEIFDYIPSGVSFDIGGDLLPKLVANNAPFYGIRMDFEWVDIGKVPDYWRAIQDVLTGVVNLVDIPGQEIRPGVYAGLNVKANWDKIHIEGPVYIGGMTHIEDGAKIIGPSAIGNNCCLCSGAIVDKSVIFEYSRIGPGVRLVDKLVFGRYCVDKTGASIDMKAAALDWLITDTRQEFPTEPPVEHRAIVELLEQHI
jgi:mannose-1-phosphate guanylyltransferase